MWWCFTTGAGLPVKYSSDGLAWNQGTRLFETERPWWRDWAPQMGALDVWAPDIQQFDGRYWCYYSVSEFGRNNSAIGLMSCTSILAGDWRDDGFVIGSRSGQQAFNAIDPNLTIDTTGQPWLTFGSWFDGIQIVKLDPVTMKPVGEVQAIARRPNGIEAPIIVYARGYYHLFLSIDLCCRGVNSTYKIVHGRATAITGPYFDKDDVPLLAGGGTLLETAGARWKGPGGEDVYRHGDDWVIARHSYDAQSAGIPKLRINDLYWDDDKWPSYTQPVAPPTILSHPLSLTQLPDTAATLEVSATGTSVTYQWFKDDAVIPGATTDTLSFGALQASDAGLYEVEASDPNGTTRSRPAWIKVASPQQGAIINMSVRSTAGVDGHPLIVGFFTADGSKEVLIRGIGPRLTALGVGDVMEDPAMDVFSGPNIVARNDNWADDGLAATLTAAFTATGAFLLPDETSPDAALITTVTGGRTVHVNRVLPGASGVVLAEVYDIEPSVGGRLINVSARNFAGRDSDTLIAGFYLSGNVPQRVLIRGVGPTLSDFDVSGVLHDPQLELHTTIAQLDRVIATNDDWRTEPGAADAMTAAFAFTLWDESGDAVIVTTLPPGGYTVHVTGVGATTGEALVEVYELP